MTPPPGFSTPPQIPSNTTSERLLVTTTVFTATTPENTPFAYHASTSTNPNPRISLAFVEANYEILKSLLRERQRQIRNKDLRTELKYFSEDYDEEREIEPRPEPRREATSTLRLREGNRRGRNVEGIRPLEIEAREGSVTPFVQWIDEYPLSDRLKMPSHIGSYDGKGDLDNFLHLFKGVATNGASNNQRDSFERSKKSSWDNNRGQKNRDSFSPYRGPSHGLLPCLSKSPKEILVTEKAARSFEPPLKMFRSKRSQATSKYCHFHKDYEHDTNDCRRLRTQIQEAVNSRDSFRTS
ncbi:hypothetical protein Tco_0548201 [Tanacetum coccineum]